MNVSLRALRLAVVLSAALGITAVAANAQVPVEQNASSERASSYYNFSMGHLYAEMAQAYNRQDYVNKAIDYYRAALKEDPSAHFINEELTDLYIQSGQLNKAVTEAEDLLKQSPDNLGARRILGRVYTRLIGDPQQGKIDEKMLKLSIEQYAIIVAKDPKDTESELLLGRLYRLSHDSVSAEKTYKDVLAKDSDNDEALAGIAGIYADRGDAKHAIEVLKRAGDTSPSARTMVTLAALYEQDNDYGSAADAWQKALQLAPENERWKRALAQDLLFSDRVEDARKLYKEILAENPKDAQIHLRLAEIYRQQRDFEKSRQALDEAKKLDGGDLDIRYEEVNLLDAEGKPDDAIKALKAILDQTSKAEYSSQERSQRNRLEERLGMLYRSAGKYQQAVTIFKEIGTNDPDAAARASVQVVETWRQAKDISAARRESDAAFKKYPKDRVVVLDHAQLLAEGGNVDQAVSEVNALKDGKNDREILLSTAQFYERAKRFADEAKAIDQAEKMSSSKADIEAVRFMRGAMYERMKDFDAAEAEFRKVLNDNPNNAGALNYLGYMLADRNLRLDEAQDLITKALQIDPKNGAYLDSLGWVYFRKNRLDDAEDQLRQALARIGNDPTVHDHLGDVLNKMGKVAEAVAQWQSSLKNYGAVSSPDTDPAEVAKVQRKLDDARIRVAQQPTQTHKQVQ